MNINSSSIKLVRLARLLRLVRLVKTLKGFDALFLLTTALKGSTAVLGWAFVLLLLVHAALSILINQFLQATYFEDSSKPLLNRQQVYEYFGTFSRAMCSMFEMTLANWPPVCRLLSEHVSEWFMLLCIMHKLIIGFAVIGVINGVFTQETLKIAGSDPDILVRQKRKAKKHHRQQMSDLFEYLDISGDGRIALEDFKVMAETDIVKKWLGQMDLEPDDLPSLFCFIDINHSGEISVEDLIKGVAKLKGPSRSVDLLRIMRFISPQGLSGITRLSGYAA